MLGATAKVNASTSHLATLLSAQPTNDTLTAGDSGICRYEVGRTYARPERQLRADRHTLEARHARECGASRSDVR